MNKDRFYNRCVKRVIDFLLSLMGLIVLSPILLTICILVRMKLGSPIIFKQDRPGLNGQIFTLYKFRTMTDDKDECGNLFSDEIRLTDFGEFLRSTSLDELPELINILKGDMSIVGPRPQLVRDLVFMNSEQRKRHDVRPGLTGLAQVNGRNNMSWIDKFKYDIIYVKKVSFSTDLKIFFKTIGKVVKKEDINTEGQATAEDYGDYLLRNNLISKVDYNKNQELAREMLEK